ncbi:hypothetical protein Pcinc_006747 [Petrolisthes cinctipes]|uniref:Interferon-related developmental regulator C-terminal domain-containing protein n=1 Tax=Petrolisthes cinctipes TaxID=88211 RepID=A0AAE1GCF3_PETCI|nr:hypothetical protein Pcinc_006747 [Petrolisthes cinctipes]
MGWGVEWWSRMDVCRDFMEGSHTDGEAGTEVTQKWEFYAACLELGAGRQVRDVFNLGPPPDPQDHTHSPALSRSQKKINKLKESTVSKARQQTRKKNRDNKATDKTYQD